MIRQRNRNERTVVVVLVFVSFAYSSHAFRVNSQSITAKRTAKPRTESVGLEDRGVRHFNSLRPHSFHAPRIRLRLKACYTQMRCRKVYGTSRPAVDGIGPPQLCVMKILWPVPLTI